MSERDYRAWLETPAGRVHQRLGVSEQRDPMAAAAFVSERQIMHKATYGREYDEGELRSLEFAAERATTRVSQAVAPPKTSWEVASFYRWGVESPPPIDAAMGDVAWIARPG